MIRLRVVCLLASLALAIAPSAKSSTTSTTTLTTTLTTSPTTSPKTHLSCKCTGGKDCTDGRCSPKTSEGVCMTMTEENTLDGNQSPTTNQTCQDNTDFCNASVAITLTKDVYWRSNSICCKSKSDCNPDSIKMPSADTTASKLVCPSCFVLNADHQCSATDESCSASETECIEVSGTITKGSKTTKFFGKGCATPGAKKIQKDIPLVFGDTTYTFTSITLRNATEAPTTPTTSPTTNPTTHLSCKCTSGNDCKDSRCSPKTSEGVCMTMTEENTLDGNQSPITNQTCQDNTDFCNASITITLTKDVYWRSNSICCKSKSDCNPDSNKIPTPDTTVSHLVCPSCFARDASSCTPTKKNCSASETKCIDVAGIIVNGSRSTTFAGKGCASATAKSIQAGTMLVFGSSTYKFTTSTLTDGASQTPGSAGFIFLLSSFVVLLQAKFIY